MKINYQLLDLNRVDELKIKYNSRNFKDFDKIIIGDLSCLNRNIYFINRLEKKFIKNIFLQMPLLTKENEFQQTIDFYLKQNPKGYITGDLGVVKVLSKKTKKEIIYTTNIINKEFSNFMKNNYNVSLIRPLMFKRVFVEEDINFPKDILIYGNMLLNCSTFCLHSKDTPGKCKFNCKQKTEVTMNKEKVSLIGRSLFTNKKFDLTNRINKIKNIESTTIFDHNLTMQEILKAVQKIKTNIQKSNQKI